MKFSHIITFIAGSLIGYLASFLLNTESRPSVGTLVIGTPDSSLVQGEIKEQVQEQIYEGHTTLKPEVRGQKSEIRSSDHASPPEAGRNMQPCTHASSGSFEKTIPLDSLVSPMSFVSLKIITFPPADSIHLSYFANIKERTFERTDTLFITRTDTLTMKEVIEQPRAFYDNFWTGAAVVALLFALISGLF